MIPILFQDPSLLVCVKSPGLLSQDGPGESLPQRLREQTGSAVYPVHRLDREVGGVMVYARTGPAAASLSAAMGRGEFQKEYLCVVLGRPEADRALCKDLLLHDRTRNKSFVVQRMRGGVREASLEYRLLASREGLSLLRVRLHTGRTHQIRVHLSHLGHPLLGDVFYDGREEPGLGRQALHCGMVIFPHVITGEEQRVPAPLPEDLRRVMDRLGLPWREEWLDFSPAADPMALPRFLRRV